MWANMSKWWVRFQYYCGLAEKLITEDPNQNRVYGRWTQPSFKGVKLAYFHRHINTSAHDHPYYQTFFCDRSSVMKASIQYTALPSWFMLSFIFSLFTVSDSLGLISVDMSTSIAKWWKEYWRSIDLNCIAICNIPENISEMPSW